MATLKSDMLKPEGNINIPELQSDLRRKYRNVGAKVEEIWRNFTPKQREKAMREAVGDGKVLKHSRDPGLAGLRRVLPDWNLQDITSTPDFFLDRLKHRVKTSLQTQHFEGANGGPGDQEIIRPAAQSIHINDVDENTFGVFIKEDEEYGQFVRTTGAEGRRTFMESKIVEFRLAIPGNEAYLVINRQTSTFTFYNSLIEEILDLGSDSRATKTASSARKATKEPANAMAKLALEPKPLKSSIAEVIAQAVEQKVALEDYLALLRSEPVVLNQSVNMTNSSRPELVPDDRGRILPMFTDKYITTAFFEVMCNAVKTIVTWEYIVRLVRMLEGDGMNDKLKRSVVVQELSNTCHLEYRRAQSELRRQMSQPAGVASKCFRRITTGGTSRVVIKGQPADYTVSDPQLHYILRICHPDAKHTEAAQWMQRLDDHNTRHPDDFQRLTGSQVLALGDVAIIVSFMHTLSTSLAMVAGSKKLGVLFTTRMGELDAELAQYKGEADFSDHVVPTGNLLEPGVASKALESLEDFVIERAGTSLGGLYEEILHDCVTDVEKKCSDAKLNFDKAQSQQQQQQPLALPTVEEPKPASFRAEQRREKAKTRPAEEVSAYNITALTPAQLEIAKEPTPQRLKVKPSTASVFSTIFAKSQARGSVSWANFTSAMADLNFSVTPKYGSVFTFHPPQSMGATRSVTLHRPHASDVEGYKLLIVSRRLYRTYGWTQETFEVEESVW